MLPVWLLSRRAACASRRRSSGKRAAGSGRISPASTQRAGAGNACGSKIVQPWKARSRRDVARRSSSTTDPATAPEQAERAPRAIASIGAGNRSPPPRRRRRPRCASRWRRAGRPSGRPACGAGSPPARARPPSRAWPRAPWRSSARRAGAARGTSAESTPSDAPGIRAVSCAATPARPSRSSAVDWARATVASSASLQPVSIGCTWRRSIAMQSANPPSEEERRSVQRSRFPGSSQSRRMVSGRQRLPIGARSTPSPTAAAMPAASPPWMRGKAIPPSQPPSAPGPPVAVALGVVGRRPGDGLGAPAGARGDVGVVEPAGLHPHEHLARSGLGGRSVVAAAQRVEAAMSAGDDGAQGAGGHHRAQRRTGSIPGGRDCGRRSDDREISSASVRHQLFQGHRVRLVRVGLGPGFLRGSSIAPRPPAGGRAEIAHPTREPAMRQVADPAQGGKEPRDRRNTDGAHRAGLPSGERRFAMTRSSAGTDDAALDDLAAGLGGLRGARPDGLAAGDRRRDGAVDLLGVPPPGAPRGGALGGPRPIARAGRCG